MICLLILPLCAYADDDSPLEPQPSATGEGSPDEPQPSATGEGSPVNNSNSSGDSADKKEKKFELGFLNINLAFTNDFLTLADIFQETIVLDIDRFSNGFRVNLNASIVPVYLNINLGGWGIGFAVNVEALGIFNLSGKMLTFSDAIDDKSDVSGALFASVEVNSYFNIQKFKIKVKPSLFYTIAYFKPDISYTFDPESGNILKLDYDVQVYTAFPLEDTGNMFDINVLPTPGIDISLGVEYAISKEFDVGLELINIPIIPSVLKNYMQFSGIIGGDEPMDLLGDGMDSLFSSFNNVNSEPSYGIGNQETRRPFRLSTWVNWRVLGTPFLTLTPMIGFSINELYTEVFSMEFGANVCLNLSDTLLITAGTNYIDRLWRNSVDFAVNLKVFEFNIGLDMRSYDFIKSWTGGGIGINFGFMVGF